MNLLMKGMLFATPLAALTWLGWAVTQRVHDTKNERNTVSAELSKAQFERDFDRRFEELGGAPVATGTSTEREARIKALNSRLIELQSQLDDDRKAASEHATSIEEVAGTAAAGSAPAQ